MTHTDGAQLYDSMHAEFAQERQAHLEQIGLYEERLINMQTRLDVLGQHLSDQQETVTAILVQEIENLRESLAQTQAQLRQTRRTVHDILLGRLGGQADPTSVVPQIGDRVIPDNPEQHLALGERFLAEKHFTEAVATFTLFLQRHDDPVRSEQALFGIGEAHFSRATQVSSTDGKNEAYRRSIIAFQRTLAAHPRSKRADRALYRIGLAFEALGHAEDARIFFEELVHRYPASTLRAKAQARLR